MITCHVMIHHALDLNLRSGVMTLHSHIINLILLSIFMMHGVHVEALHAKFTSYIL